MKKIAAMLAGAILMGACVFALGENSAKAYVERPPGTYQCAICGVIVSIVNRGTIHPIK